LKAAGIQATLDAEIAANTTLSGNWSVATDWDEKSRYEQKTQAEAQKLYEAITNNPDGVLPWIRIRW
jgi:hypothetical protein